MLPGSVNHGGDFLLRSTSHDMGQARINSDNSYFVQNKFDLKCERYSPKYWVVLAVLPELMKSSSCSNKELGTKNWVST